MFRRKRTVIALAAAVAALGIGACGSDDADSGSSASSGSGLKAVNGGRLTVGMNLQFKPQMYLERGKPAGYDVDLLNELAPAVGERLDIKNLDFNGLIPGLQSQQFDMVSVGLTATEERKRAVDFTRAYVPYALVLAVNPKDGPGADTAEAYNRDGAVITALQGSSGEQLAKKQFPKAEVKGFPDQNAAFLEVSTGRAAAIVVEDYLLAQFMASNKGALAKAPIAKPLDVQYGAWAVPQGNGDFVKFLDRWLCEKQRDGTLERIYKRAFGVKEFPPMPAGC